MYDVNNSNSRESSHKMISFKGLLSATLQLCVFIVILEIIVAMLDPLGIAAYRNGLAMLRSIRYPTNEGYALNDGQHTIEHWTVTVENGLRVVPDTNKSASKELIILGDSVAFGFGVDDSDTFANLIARQLPDWHVINTAQTGYSIGNIERTSSLYPEAECLVYVSVSNDNESDVLNGTETYVYMPALLAYGQYYVLRSIYPVVGYDDWLKRAKALFDSGVLITVFDESRQAESVKNANLPFPIIPRHKSTVSYGDSHPDATAHQAITDSLMPLITEWCK